jgi:acyl-CoA reductase-like NAD-dependent aldehyde dehydrogenase
VLGAIVNAAVLKRLERSPSYGRVVLPSRPVAHPDFPRAIVRTPTIVRLDAPEQDTYGEECFGPVSFLIATDSIAESIQIFRDTVRERGAITALVHSSDAEVLQEVEQVALETGVALSCNLTNGVYVNQSAAFSDFHATGANPAANAALTDAAFVAARFRIVQVRSPLVVEAPSGDALSA